MFGTKPKRDFLMLEIYNKDNARFFLLQNIETLMFANFQNLYDSKYRNFDKWLL